MQSLHCCYLGGQEECEHFNLFSWAEATFCAYTASSLANLMVTYNKYPHQTIGVASLIIVQSTQPSQMLQRKKKNELREGLPQVISLPYHWQETGASCGVKG